MPTEPTECSPQQSCQPAAEEEELRQPQKDVRLFRKQPNQYPQTPLGYSRAYIAKTGPARPAPENKKPATSSSSSRSSSSVLQDGCPVPAYPPAPPLSAGKQDAEESSGLAQTPRPPSFSETQREKQLRRERSKTNREVVGTRSIAGAGASDSADAEREPMADDLDEATVADTQATCSSSHTTDAATILDHLSVRSRRRITQLEAVEAAYKDGRLSKQVYEQAQRDLRQLDSQEMAREERVSPLKPLPAAVCAECSVCAVDSESDSDSDPGSCAGAGAPRPVTDGGTATIRGTAAERETRYTAPGRHGHSTGVAAAVAKSAAGAKRFRAASSQCATRAGEATRRTEDSAAAAKG